MSEERKGKERRKGGDSESENREKEREDKEKKKKKIREGSPERHFFSNPRKGRHVDGRKKARSKRERNIVNW